MPRYMTPEDAALAGASVLDLAEDPTGPTWAADLLDPTDDDQR
ncbi:hypothetical protein [Streptomyces sp. CB03911]|nr:hypothetical protein [Streptomyces sp. CB03911]